jgi:hypothetical protein
MHPLGRRLQVRGSSHLGLRSGALIAVDLARGRITGGWVIPLEHRELNGER